MDEIKQNYGNKWIVKLFPLITLVLLSIFLFIELQATQEFSYFYREQQQMFLHDANYITNLVCQIGGLGIAISQYLVQYFALTKMGAMATALFSFLSGWFLWLSMKQKNTHWYLAPLCMLPALFFNLYMADNYVHYEGLIALCAMAVCLCMQAALWHCHYAVRVVLSSLLALALYVGFGPVAVLFGVVLLLNDIMLKQPKKWLSTIPLACVLLAGLFAVNQGYTLDLSTAYWMQGYVEYYFNPGLFYSWSWISVLLVVILCNIVTLGLFVSKAKWVFGMLGFIALPAMYVPLNQSHQDMEMYKMERVAYYANHEKWDIVAQEAQLETGNYIFLNYLNLANSKMGILLDRLFTIPQAGSQSLIISNSQVADVSKMLAGLYYHAGVIGHSQVHAYSSNMAVTYGSPEMNKLMIKNYLINGQYKVAEKHIKQLEKTTYYAAWAKDMRRFLRNDQALQADAELGTKRRDLPENDGFTAMYGPLNDMMMVLISNPAEKYAAEYAIGMLLLDQDFSSIATFVERFYGKLSIWPVCLQEAIVAYSEKDMDYCRRYGVSEEVIQRFAQFRQETLQLRHGGGSMQQLARNWGSSFWYYMLKTKNNATNNQVNR